MYRNKDFLLTELAGNSYLLPYGQMIADQKHWMQINHTGVYIWNLLQKDCSREEILTQTAKHFQIAPSDFLSFSEDINMFLNLLLAQEVLLENKTSSISSSKDTLTLSIGALSIKLEGDPKAFPPQFVDFSVDSVSSLQQTIYLHPQLPSIRRNGQILVRDRDLIVMDTPEEYLLLFPAAKQLYEIHINKSGSLAILHYTPPYTELLYEEIFQGIRLIYSYLAQMHGMFIIHSASLLYNDKAWLFSGPSGMGKSTHTNLWKNLYQSSLLNGDLNMITLENNVLTVHGIPWCGTSQIHTTKSYPLGGIILLKQDATDFIESLTDAQKQTSVAQRFISPTWTQEMFLKNLNFAEMLCKQVPICRLHCTKNPHAAEVMKSYIDNYC